MSQNKMERKTHLFAMANRGSASCDFRWNPALLLTSCVVLEKSLHLSETQFPHLLQTSLHHSVEIRIE